MIAAGYALGPVFLLDAARRRHLLLTAAAVLLLTFVALRSGNFYGDNQPWAPQHAGAMWDLISFLRVQKYPPSLLYICVTMGLSLPLLVLLEWVKPIPLLMLFGGSPMFFYVIHIALIHFLAGPYFLARYGALPQGSPLGMTFPDGYEPSLPVVYAAWVGIIAIMYALTRWWRRRRTVAPAAASVQPS